MNNRIQIVAVLLVLFAVLLVLFWPTALSLHHRWADTEGTYAHGYLVLAMVAYMLWDKLQPDSGFWSARESEASGFLLGPRFSFLVVAVTAIGTSLVWFAGHLTFTNIIAQLALPLLYACWVVLVLGMPTARYFLLPILFFYFAIPVWGVLIEPLRLVAIWVTQNLLQLTGTPALVDGFYIHLPSGIVEIAGGCSGANFLLTGLVLGIFYAITQRDGRAHWWALALIVALSLIANWLRIYLLVLIGYYSEMKHPLMQDHASFGWVIYAVMLVIFFAVLTFIASRKGGKDGIEVVVPARDAAPAAGKAVQISVSGAGIVALCAVLPVMTNFVSQSGSSVVEPMQLENRYWLLEGQPASDWLPAYKGYDQVQRWVYVGSFPYPVTLFALHYHEQAQGKELVYDGNVLAERGLENSGALALENGKQLDRSYLSSGSSVSVLYSTYLVGEYQTNQPLLAKFYQALAYLHGHSRASLLVFGIDCGASCEHLDESSTVILIDEALSSIAN